jgi:hypothetical protein
LLAGAHVDVIVREGSAGSSGAAGPARPPRATENANSTRGADPHKVVVDTLWDRLPEAVKVAVAAMVKAVAK